MAKEKIEHYLQGLQHKICEALEQVDGEQQFDEDQWLRQEGGGGRSRVLAGGAVFEQAGVNYSRVHGKELPKSASIARPDRN